MTRINLSSPYSIADQFLIAEYKELPRVFTLTLNAQNRGETPATYGIPEQFRLGAGHMKFFANKLGYLHERYTLIVNECMRRGFNIQYPELRPEYFEQIETQWFGYYTPTFFDLATSAQRLTDKISMKPSFYTHCGNRIYV